MCWTKREKSLKNETKREGQEKGERGRFKGTRSAELGRK